MNIIENKLILAGVKNLKEYGYLYCDKENILTDQIYKAFFLEMLKNNKGKAGDEVDNAIDSIIARIKK